MDGDNGVNAELQRRANRRIEALDLIAEQQDIIKAYKAEDKSDGFDEKALAVAIKGLRKGPDAHADQLAFELVVKTYREAVGLPTDAAAAQKAALDAIGDELRGEDRYGSDDERGGPEVFGENDTVHFGDGEPIPARDFARAAKAVGRGKRAKETMQ